MVGSPKLPGRAVQRTLQQNNREAPRPDRGTGGEASGKAPQTATGELRKDAHAGAVHTRGHRCRQDNSAPRSETTNAGSASTRSSAPGRVWRGGAPEVKPDETTTS